MKPPRIPETMIAEARKSLEWQLQSLERALKSREGSYGGFDACDAIARTHFYLGDDEAAKPYFRRSIVGAKLFQIEVIEKRASEASKPSEVTRGLYAIARPLWWLGDAEGIGYFERAIQQLALGRAHKLESERRTSLSIGVCFLIGINELNRAREWLDELEQNYGLSEWQKWLEILRTVVQHKPSSSKLDLGEAFNRLSRHEQLERSLPFYSSPSQSLMVYEWLRRQLED